MAFQLELALPLNPAPIAAIVPFPSNAGQPWRKELAGCHTYSDALRTGYRLVVALEEREESIYAKVVPEGVQACFSFPTAG